MSLENWVKNNWLEQRESDAAEIGRLLVLADGRLEDYRRAVAGKLSADVQLSLAYDVIRISATAAVRAAGYRVVRGANEHYRTIEALNGLKVKAIRFVCDTDIKVRTSSSRSASVP